MTVSLPEEGGGRWRCLHHCVNSHVPSGKGLQGHRHGIGWSLQHTKRKSNCRIWNFQSLLTEETRNKLRSTLGIGKHPYFRTTEFVNIPRNCIGQYQLHSCEWLQELFLFGWSFTIKKCSGRFEIFFVWNFKKSFTSCLSFSMWDSLHAENSCLIWFFFFFCQ